MGNIGRNKPCPCGSGKKYKHCCLNKANSAGGSLWVQGDYAQMVISEYLCELGDSFNKGRELDAMSIVAGFLRPLAAPSQFNPATSIDILKLFLQRIEGRISEVVSRHHVYYWLHLYRRLAPENWVDNVSPVTVALTRDILECAFFKYGRLEIGEDLLIGDPVDVSAIMSGEYVRILEKHTGKSYPIGRTKPGVFIGNFSIDHFLEMLSLERLAVEYWHLTACLRRAYKDGELVILPGGQEYHVENDPVTEKLMQSYDRRNASFNSHATSKGMPLDYVFDLLKLGDGFVLVPSYNVGRVSAEELPMQVFWGLPAEMTGGGDFRPNFVWLPFDLESFYERHVFLSVEFGDSWGFSLEAFVACIHAFFSILMINGYKDLSYVYTLQQRAYSHWTSIEGVVQSLSNAYNSRPASFLKGHILGEEEIRAFLTAFSWSVSKRQQIDLSTRGPRPLVLPTWGNGCLVDYVALSHILETATHFIDTNWTAKGSQFEDYVTSLLRKRGAVLWECQKELTAEDGSKNDVDVSFIFGNTVFVCELRSTGKSFAYEKGDSVALAFRREKIEEAINDSDDLARWLARHPTGRNYSIPSEIAVVVSLAVFPTVEYIWSDNPALWMTNEIPRCCTPSELVRLNTSEALQDITHKSFAYFIK